MASCGRIFVSVLLCSTPFVSCLQAGDDDQTEKQIFALQRRIQKTIAQVEPAIVCISVSRSGEYARLDPPIKDNRPGELGGFDFVRMTRLLKRLGIPADLRRRKVKQLNLAHRDCAAESQGTGVALGRNGLILTNNHLVSGAAKIYVRFDGNQGSYADIFAADSRSDLAVLRLLTPPAGLPPVAVGNGAKCKRGQFVISLQRSVTPGFRNEKCTVSWGIVSAVRLRTGNGLAGRGVAGSLHTLLLQIDRSGVAARSGAAVFDLDGKLVGLMTALPAVGGLGNGPAFVVPLTPAVQRVIAVMQRGEEVDYGYLGVRIFQNKPQESAVVIHSVIPGSPADGAGLKAFDSIHAVNGQRLRHPDDYYRQMSAHLAGTKVKLRVQMPQAALPHEVAVVLAKYHFPGKAIAARTKRPFFRGLRVDDASLVVQKKFDAAAWKRIPKGVVITEVQPNSPAATKFLKPGEIISHVNGRPILSPTDFYRTVRFRSGRIELTILSSEPNNPKAKVMLN